MSHGWQAPFRVLRDQFLAAARENFQVKLALASFPHHDGYRLWHERTIDAELLREVSSPMNRVDGRSTSVEALGLVWGRAEGVRRFDALAREAGNSLPFDFYPATRLFPWFNELSNVNPGPVTLWSEFLFVARFTSFQVSEDWPVPGCRVARLNGDPFLVSATAIERYVLSPDAPALGEYFRLMRTVCPWLTNNAGGFPMTPPGILAPPFLRFDLPSVFRCAVELGGALTANDVHPDPPSDDAEAGKRFAAILEAGRAVEVASDRLLCAVNPRFSRVGDWSRQVDLADASPDARQAVRTLGLALADIRGDGEYEARGRGLLSGGACHLWCGMRAEERAVVRELLVETNRVWGWPTDPVGEPGEYTGPRATLSEPRVIDSNRWRTTRPEFLNQLQTTMSRQNFLVDTIRLPDGEYFDIFRDDVKATRYSTPSVCRHAEPKPPVELLPEGEQLADLECRFRDLGLIGPDESIHWVGRQARTGTRCECELTPAEFYEPRPPEWRTLRDLKAAIVSMMKLVWPYVETRKAGLVYPADDLAMFDALAERAYGLAQSLSLPLPPVVVNPNVQRAHPHGPAALPVHELSGGRIISESEGRQWLSNWRAVRVGIDARLDQIDRAARPAADADGIDTRDLPLDAPAGTPSPLREAFNSVANALFEVADFRRNPPSGSILFGELGRGLTSRVRAAEQQYAAAELHLQAAADAEGCAHQETLVATRRVTDAIGHVMLGVVPDHMAVAHLRQVPALDVAVLLRRMRQQTSRAAQAVRVGSGLLAPGTSHPDRLSPSPNEPSPRIRCDESDRSVYLDGKRVAGEVELAVFRFFRAVAESYPDPISYRAIRSRAPGLHGKHPTRDLKDRLPAPLGTWVQSGKHGYFLRLPAPK